MTTYAVCSVLAFLTTWSLTPVLRRVALSDGHVDLPGPRKIHQTATPRLGGVVLVLAFYLPVLAAVFYGSGVGVHFAARRTLAYGMLAGGFLIAVLGVYDDLRGLSAWPKFLCQLAVGALMVGLGFRFRIPVGVVGPQAVDVLGAVLGVLWIVGITNAMNLLDGLDGLAAGSSFITVAMLAGLALASQAVFLALVCVTLAGALLGFLLHNVHPAKMFLGDSGSMFLGFVLAVASIETSYRAPLIVALLTPLLALGLPIVDTLLAIVRRARSKSPIFTGDRDHIHHRLLRGVGHRRSVHLLYGVTSVTVASAAALMVYRHAALGPVLIAEVGLAVLLVRLMRSDVDVPPEVSAAFAAPERDEADAVQTDADPPASG